MFIPSTAALVGGNHSVEDLCLPPVGGSKNEPDPDPVGGTHGEVPSTSARPDRSGSLKRSLTGANLVHRQQRSGSAPRGRATLASPRHSALGIGRKADMWDRKTSLLLVARLVPRRAFLRKLATTSWNSQPRGRSVRHGYRGTSQGLTPARLARPQGHPTGLRPVVSVLRKPTPGIPGAVVSLRRSTARSRPRRVAEIGQNVTWSRCGFLQAQFSSPMSGITRWGSICRSSVNRFSTIRSTVLARFPSGGQPPPPCCRSASGARTSEAMSVGDVIALEWGDNVLPGVHRHSDGRELGKSRNRVLPQVRSLIARGIVLNWMWATSSWPHFSQRHRAGKAIAPPSHGRPDTAGNR